MQLRIKTYMCSDVHAIHTVVLAIQDHPFSQKNMMIGLKLKLKVVLEYIKVVSDGPSCKMEGILKWRGLKSQ